LPKGGDESRDETARAESMERIEVAVVGHPNVGKSSLVNRILGYERSIVSEVAGTTRDAIDTALTAREHDWLLTDTAGIRTKARIRHVSAVSGEGVDKLLDDAADAFKEYKHRVPTPKLNAWLEAGTDSHPPPVSGRGPVKMNFVTMGGTRPPAVVIFTNHPEA